MNVCWVDTQVSDPGRDNSSSGGGSDLGAAKKLPGGLELSLDEKESPW